MDVRYLSGESYEVSVRGHRVLVDQPAEAGGLDTAPTPTELFVASLATCVAFYAGRYLTRHGYGRDGLAVSADFDMASDRPARVSGVRPPSGRRPSCRPTAGRRCTRWSRIAPCITAWPPRHRSQST
ncbi:MAG: OsmC family protein [Streptosporangiaceae bacterium]